MEARPSNILSLEELADQIARLKNEGKRVVMCHGVFDLVHIGHIRHFEQARSFGDILVVTLTPDCDVNKGSHRPAFPETLRAETVGALGVVDYVGINRWPSAEDTIRILKPDVFCKGGEYRQRQVDADSNLLPEIQVAKEIGAVIEYTDDVVFSSSKLLNQHFSPFPPETDEWLESFRSRYPSDDVINRLEDLRSKKVLVVGEAIIDEYVLCNSIGKSTKDPILASQYIATEAFAGGSLAIANHLAGFCDNVGLITSLGETERREDFVRQSLLSNISPTFITNHGAPTIHKRRFVDHYSQNKLFELYIMEDRPLLHDDEARLLEVLQADLPEYDVVIVADYGHGLLSPSAIKCLCKNSKFLAVNTQSNAGNRGFNSISRYPLADYVCLADHEIRMETRMREGEIENLFEEVAERIACDHFTVTLGKRGSLHYEPEGGFHDVPAFATQVTDRVGAGDAVLALTSLLASVDAPWELVGFVGNVAGAQMVTELGNRVPVSKIPLAKHIISLLK